MSSNVTEEMKAFSLELARKRSKEVRTSIANPDFVDRMTSSAADPDAAQKQADAEAAKAATPDSKA